MNEQLTVEKTWWSRVKMKGIKIERKAYNMGDKSKKKISIFLTISNRTAEGYCVYACC